jgi:purine-binding chemotaxis protein CheW
MKTAAEKMAHRLDELRTAFDESFAVPARSQDLDQEDMLAIAVGSHRYAVRVSELAGVNAVRKIVPLPNAPMGLLGVVGIRGRLVAAYRLGDLLGAGSLTMGGPPGQAGLSPHTPRTMGGPPGQAGLSPHTPFEGRLRWLLVCRGDNQVALAIEGLEAYLRVSRALIHPTQDEAVIGGHVREVLRQQELARGVLNVESILESIAQRARAVPQRKEA